MMTMTTGHHPQTKSWVRWRTKTNVSMNCHYGTHYRTELDMHVYPLSYTCNTELPCWTVTTPTTLVQSCQPPWPAITDALLSLSTLADCASFLSLFTCWRIQLLHTFVHPIQWKCSSSNQKYFDKTVLHQINLHLGRFVSVKLPASTAHFIWSPDKCITLQTAIWNSQTI